MFNESLGDFYIIPWPAPADRDGTFGIGFLRTNYKFRVVLPRDASDRLVRDVLVGLNSLSKIVRRK